MKIAHRMLAAGLCIATASICQADLLDWQLIGRGGQVLSGQGHNLFNVTDKENLVYGSRTVGINLVWDKAPRLHNVQVFNKGAKGSPVRYAEYVALYVRGGGYLKHEKRTFGINLGWSSKPVYQWQIGGNGGDPGTTIKQGDLLILHNSAVRDAVIYDRRAVGINLVWAKDKGSKTWKGLFLSTLTKVGSVSKKMMDWLMSLYPEGT